jgi:hypothetical protein
LRGLANGWNWLLILSYILTWLNVGRSLNIKATFRQTEGFIASLFEAMKLDLQTPSYSQLCRRQAQLTQQLTPAPSPSASQEPIYVVVDSTGLKVYGEGDGAAL